MIMLVKLLRALLVSSIAVVIASCAPDLDIHLSECMQKCNDAVVTCTTDTNKQLNQCADIACQRDSIDKTEKCFIDALTCTTACVDVAEKKLKSQ